VDNKETRQSEEKEIRPQTGNSHIYQSMQHGREELNKYLTRRYNPFNANTLVDNK